MASSSQTLKDYAATVGGKVRGDKVEYQVKGNGYKATRYITLNEIQNGAQANLNPYSSRPDGKGEKNGPNGQYGAITPSALVNPGVASIPGAPTPQNPGNLVGANNIPLAGALAGDGYSLDQKGQYTFSAPKAEDNFSNLFSQYTDALGSIEMPNNTALYDKIEKDAKIRQKENAVSTYTNQINNITTKAQAESLALEGQGRGITESIIGGQQAKINREAAIQALPIQAQLAAASGDLESARNFVAQRFQLLAQDAQQQYQYKTKLIDTVYNFATGQEQRRLDAIKVKEDQAFQIQMQNLKFQQDKDMLDYEAGLADATATSSAATPEHFDFLISTAQQAYGLADQSGQGSIARTFGDLVGGSKYRQLEQQVNTLRSNMLTLSTDPNIKKFFGPQMSNADVLLMTSAGTTLNPGALSGDQMRAEVKRVEDFLVRARSAVSQGLAGATGGTPSALPAVTAPDGTQIIIID